MATNHLRRKISARMILLGIAVIALCTWGGLFFFTYHVPPQGAAVLIVFLPLSVALYCTCTLLIYFVSWAILATRARRPGIGQALRQGGLTAAWLIFNLILRALHSWSLFSTIVSLGIIVVIELLVLGQG